MKLKFQTLDFTASQELTDFIQGKVEKLVHLFFSGESGVTKFLIAEPNAEPDSPLMIN